MDWLKEYGLAIIDTLVGLAGLFLAYLAFYGFTGDDFPQFSPQPVVQGRGDLVTHQLPRARLPISSRSGSVYPGEADQRGQRST